MRYTFIPETEIPETEPRTKIYSCVPAAKPKGETRGFLSPLTQDVDLSGGLPLQFFFSKPEQVMEIDVPWYQLYPSMLTNVGVPTKSSASTVPYNEGTQLICDTSVPYNIFRTIGEDFSFGYLLGPPINFLRSVP